eukprot:1394683-Amorphochlora_amoeboformis.AAC.1
MLNRMSCTARPGIRGFDYFIRETQIVKSSKRDSIRDSGFEIGDSRFWFRDWRFKIRDSRFEICIRDSRDTRLERSSDLVASISEIRDVEIRDI